LSSSLNPVNPMSSLLIGGLDNPEPWQGRWNGGVLVECVGRAEPEVNIEGLPGCKI
jgi:hypothetical protein